HDPEIRQRSDHALGDRRVLEKDCDAVASRSNDVALRLAVPALELEAGIGEEPALELEIGKVVVGEQHLRHEASFSRPSAERLKAPATPERYVAPGPLVKWPDRSDAEAPGRATIIRRSPILFAFR